MSQLFIHGVLVRIKLLVYKTLCRQEGVMLKPKPTPTDVHHNQNALPSCRWGTLKYFIMSYAESLTQSAKPWGSYSVKILTGRTRVNTQTANTYARAIRPLKKACNMR